ncbi:MAG: ABC transporter substrate-binding protein [Alphaproteobacteria bacterium]|nr:ABC transporter substrate-binding protein [Alphaproteobacteria bacterium]
MKKVLLSLMMATSLVACGEKTEAPKENEKPVVKIGAVLPLTGNTSMLGESLKAGILAAVADRKDTKHKYEIVWEDDQHSPAKAVAAAHKLISSDKVNAVVTFMLGMGRAIAPVADRAGVITLVATLEQKNMKPMGKMAIVQGPSVESFQARSLEVFKKKGVKKIALIAANVGVSCSGTQQLGKKLSEDGVEAVVECFNPGERNFRLLLSKYNDYSDFYVSGFPPETELLISQLLEMGVKKDRIFGQGMDTGEIVEEYNGINHISPSNGTPEFVERLTKEYGLKNVYMAATTYDLINLIIDAFENVSEKSNEKVLEYMKLNATRKCMSGTCEIQPNGFIVNEAEWRTYKDGMPVVMNE